MNPLELSFKPRFYQEPIYQALRMGFKKIIAVLPRRSGKDLTAFSVITEEALSHKANYLYCLPEFAHARRVIWDNITLEGKRVIDYIPKELIYRMNENEMKITLVNGSIISLAGSDAYDKSIVGRNFRGIVFSEAAQMNIDAYRYARPIVAASDGFMIFISTPRGKGEFYDLYIDSHKYRDEWFSYRMTVEETCHMTPEQLEREKRAMSDDMYAQEYLCSFEMGIEGTFYGKIIDKMKLNGQITSVPWNPQLKVHTAWDLGVARNMAVLCFQQTKAGEIRIIDCIQLDDGGIPHYINALKEKPYTYGAHIAPHDVNQRDIGSGLTRAEVAASLGFNFNRLHAVSVLDGIEQCKINLPRTLIDDKRCAHLVKCLENYRQEWDGDKRRYKDNPVKDWATHMADAYRYLCMGLNSTREGLTAKQLDDMYRQALVDRVQYYEY